MHIEMFAFPFNLTWRDNGAGNYSFTLVRAQCLLAIRELSENLTIIYVRIWTWLLIIFADYIRCLIVIKLINSLHWLWNLRRRISSFRCDYTIPFEEGDLSWRRDSRGGTANGQEKSTWETNYRNAGGRVISTFHLPHISSRRRSIINFLLFCKYI